MKILAATDLSEDTRHMVDFTAKLVKQCGSKMYLLHMVPTSALTTPLLMPNNELFADYEASLPAGPDRGECLIKSADARVKQLAEQVRREWGVPIYGKAEEAADLVTCLDSFCERHHIDMLVINNRQHSLLGSLLLGNTAEKLMRNMRIPIVVVPAVEKKA